MIFSGTVTSVRPIRATRTDEVETAQISFHVDHAIRGVKNRQTLVVREWAGLWAAGSRYRTGERVLLFLYPPSKLGLTSPVGGAVGQFAFDDQGRVIIGNAVNPEPRFGVPGSPATFKLPRSNRVTYGQFVRAIRQAVEE
jgi:hypothetical protein